MSSLENKVKNIIAQQLSVSVESIVPGARFIEDLGADSLDTVELVMALEEAFEVDIPDEKAEGILTYDDVVRYLEAHVAKAA
jgi:acyl carrier protein